MTDKGKKPFDISGELYLNEVDQTTQKAVDEQTDLSIDLKKLQLEIARVQLQQEIEIKEKLHFFTASRKWLLGIGLFWTFIYVGLFLVISIRSIWNPLFLAHLTTVPFIVISVICGALPLAGFFIVLFFNLKAHRAHTSSDYGERAKEDKEVMPVLPIQLVEKMFSAMAKGGTPPMQ